MVRAIETAKRQQMGTVTFLGRDGGTCAGQADVELLVRNPATARVQEAHLILYHCLCEMVETALSAGQSANEIDGGASPATPAED